MTRQRETERPFDSLESAHEFTSLLREAVDEAYASMLEQAQDATESAAAERRVEALRPANHKLNQLRRHVLASVILLNDLRRLRRILLLQQSG